MVAFEKDVGAISGVEKITAIGGFQSSYRSITDGLRIKESKIYSTPILEGSSSVQRMSGGFLVNKS